MRAEQRPPRRNGVGDGVYEQWKAELGRLGCRLHKDATEHDGVRFVDGRDPHRAVFSSKSEDDKEYEDDTGNGNGDANDDDGVAMDDTAGQKLGSSAWRGTLGGACGVRRGIVGWALKSIPFY